jgi:hypothetical protein
VAKDPMARVLLSRWAGEEPQQLYHILDCMASRLFHLCRDILGFATRGESGLAELPDGTQIGPSAT